MQWGLWLQSSHYFWVLCMFQVVYYFACIISFLNYPLNNCMNACMDALMEWIISSHVRDEKMRPRLNNLYKVPWLSGYQKKRNSTWFQSLALYYSVTLLFCYLYSIFPVFFYFALILKSTTSQVLHLTQVTRIFRFSFISFFLDHFQ